MIPIFYTLIDSETDREFMERLYLKYRRLMYNQIMKITRDPSITDDLAQDVLVSLIRHVEELREKDRDHLVNYIISCCKNRAFGYLRRRSLHPEIDLEELGDIPDYSQDRSYMEARLIEADELAPLYRIWNRLDERNRYILESFYILEKPSPEIARDLGIGPNSARMALTRARKAALRLLQEDAENEQTEA